MNALHAPRPAMIYEALAGMDVRRSIHEALALADQMDLSVLFLFNTVWVEVSPGSDADEVFAKWKRDFRGSHLVDVEEREAAR